MRLCVHTVESHEHCPPTQQQPGLGLKIVMNLKEPGLVKKRGFWFHLSFPESKTLDLLCFHLYRQLHVRACVCDVYSMAD